MKKNPTLSTTFVSLILPLAITMVRALHQTEVLDFPVVGGKLPYEIELREISLDPAPLPGIHSVAADSAGGFHDANSGFARIPAQGSKRDDHSAGRQHAGSL